MKFIITKQVKDMSQYPEPALPVTSFRWEAHDKAGAVFAGATSYPDEEKARANIAAVKRSAAGAKFAKVEVVDAS